MSEDGQPTAQPEEDSDDYEDYGEDDILKYIAPRKYGDEEIVE